VKNYIKGSPKILISLGCNYKIRVGQFHVCKDLVKFLFMLTRWKFSSHKKFRKCLNNHFQFSVSKDKKTVSCIQFSARYKTELEKLSPLSIWSSGRWL